MDREIEVETGVEPGAIPQQTNVTVHLQRDPNDPRIVKKARLVSGIANSYVGQERVIVRKLNKEIIDAKQDSND